MEKQDMRVLTLDPYQHGVVINALNNLRNDLIEDKRPTVCGGADPCGVAGAADRPGCFRWPSRDPSAISIGNE